MIGSGVLSTAVSGLQASAERFNVAANNIVNANTDGYRAQRVNAVSQSVGDQAGGVRNVLSEGGAVDLASEIVETIFAGISYSANARVIRSTEETLGQLLDIRA